MGMDLTLGGELMVRHNGLEVKFDWSAHPQAIQWAAFYSDCEHEVLPVTSGYCVTLTYNLYFGTAEPVKNSAQLECWSLPIYQDFSKALKSKDFLPTGTTG
jgi:hypothetical protein